MRDADRSIERYKCTAISDFAVAFFPDGCNSGSTTSGRRAAVFARIGIELGAVFSICHDLPVGTAETWAGLVSFTTPDDLILQNFPHLLRRSELVHEGRAHPPPGETPGPQATVSVYVSPAPVRPATRQRVCRRQASPVSTDACPCRSSACEFPRTSRPAHEHGCWQRDQG